MIAKSIYNGTTEELLPLIEFDWVKILEENNVITIQKEDNTAETTTELNAISFIENVGTINNLIMTKNLATNITFNLKDDENLIVLAEQPTLASLNDALTGINNIGNGKLFGGIETATSTIDLRSNLTCENVYFNHNCNFYQNSVLQNIIVGKNITTLGNNYFNYCKSLKTINLSNVSSLGEYCFATCTNLTTIDLSNVSTIGIYCFYQCKNLSSIIFSSSLTSLNNNTFQNCSSLTSLDISNVSSIGNSCFNGCFKLEMFNGPNANSFGTYCFGNCSKLTSLNAPNVNSIDNNCFYYCTSLSELHIGVLTTCGTTIFNGVSQPINIYIHTTNLTDATNTATTLNTNKGGTCTLTFYYGSDDNWTQITL